MKWKKKKKKHKTTTIAMVMSRMNRRQRQQLLPQQRPRHSDLRCFQGQIRPLVLRMMALQLPECHMKTYRQQHAAASAALAVHVLPTPLTHELAANRRVEVMVPT